MMVIIMKKPDTPTNIEPLWSKTSSIAITIGGGGGGSTPQLYANGLNMRQVTVTFDLLDADGKNLKGTIPPDTLNKAVQLIDFNVNNGKVITYPKLSACPTLQNPSPPQAGDTKDKPIWPSGFAYTETSNQFFIAPDSLSGHSAATPPSDNPEDKATVVFYLLYKGTPTDSTSIGVRIKPTAVGATDGYISSAAGNKTPANVKLLSQKQYDHTNIKTSPFEVQGTDSTDIWNDTGPTPSINDYWRQANFTITLDDYQGALYSTIPKYVATHTTPETASIATWTNNGYSTDLYLWSSDDPSKINLPIFFANGYYGPTVKTANVSIGDAGNTTGIRATLVFRVCTQYASMRSTSKTAIHIYDMWGNACTVFVSSNLPTYTAATDANPATITPTSYNPFVSTPTSNDQGNRACSFVNSVGGSMEIQYNNNDYTRVVCYKQDGGYTTNFGFHQDPSQLSQIYFQLFDASWQIIVRTGSADGKNQSLVLAAALPDLVFGPGGSMQWPTYYYLKPIWATKQFAISAAAANHLLKASNSFIAYTNGTTSYKVQTDNAASQTNLPDLPGFVWSIKAV
jgi:hypothetical protein